VYAARDFLFDILCLLPDVLGYMVSYRLAVWKILNISFGIHRMYKTFIIFCNFYGFVSYLGFLLYSGCREFNRFLQPQGH